MRRNALTILALAAAASSAEGQAAPAGQRPSCTGPQAARAGRGQPVRVTFAPPVGKPLDYRYAIRQWNNVDPEAKPRTQVRTWRLVFAPTDDGFALTARLLSSSAEIGPLPVYQSMIGVPLTFPVSRSRSLPATTDEERSAAAGPEVRMRSFAALDLQAILRADGSGGRFSISAGRVLSDDPAAEFPQLAVGETRYVETAVSPACQSRLDAPPGELRYLVVRRNDEQVARRRAEATVPAYENPSQRAALVAQIARLRLGGYSDFRLSGGTGLILEQSSRSSHDEAGGYFRSWTEVDIRLMNPQSLR